MNADRLLHSDQIPGGTNLNDHIIRVLAERNHQQQFFSEKISGSVDAAVLFLLGTIACRGAAQEPCLILNKRSEKVKQSGDLCCPGGGIHSRVDLMLSKLLLLPFSPLTRWPYWPQWHARRPKEARRLSRLLATALREGLEEMRVNPLRLKFLGPLPPQDLVMFPRKIFPMVCWLQGQKHFYPNWEVAKIVPIPLRTLMDPGGYARYRLSFETNPEQNVHPIREDHLCFVYHYQDRSEILWGATFRITMVFLEHIFGFIPPYPATLPVLRRTLDKTYLTGVS